MSEVVVWLESAEGGRWLRGLPSVGVPRPLVDVFDDVHDCPDEFCSGAQVRAFYWSADWEVDEELWLRSGELSLRRCDVAG